MQETGDEEEEIYDESAIKQILVVARETIYDITDCDIFRQEVWLQITAKLRQIRHWFYFQWKTVPVWNYSWNWKVVKVDIKQRNLEKIVVIISDSPHTLVGQRTEQICEWPWQLIISIVASKNSLILRNQVINFQVFQFFKNFSSVRIVTPVGNVPDGFLLLGFQFFYQVWLCRAPNYWAKWRWDSNRLR